MESDQFSDVRAVIEEPLKFKLKLGIGEDAYKTLRLKNKVSEMWDVCGAAGTGAAVAQSTVVASTFFAPHGLLAIVGLGTAVTPVGWVVAAAALSGGAYIGVRHVLSAATKDMVATIPTFINTPIDVLAISLFDLIAPLSIKIARADGEVADSERRWIRDYFVNEWGYDPKFIDAGIEIFESEIESYSIKEVAVKLAELSKNSPDCNYNAMTRGLIEFLRGVAEADGKIDEGEEFAIEKIESIFDEAGRTFSKSNFAKLHENVRKHLERSQEAMGDGIDTVAIAARKGSDYVANSEIVGRALGGVGKAIESGKEAASDTIKQVKTIARKM